MKKLRDVVLCQKHPAVWAFLGSQMIVVGAIVFRHLAFDWPPSSNDAGIVAAMTRGDGDWYAHIAARGYVVVPGRRSSAVFFPVYPAIARAISAIIRINVRSALLVVSWCGCGVACVVFEWYLRSRKPKPDNAEITWSIYMFGFAPNTFFFHMGYTESIFVCLLIIALHGMQRRWPLLLIAFIVGIATATRPVGVALLGPFAMHCYKMKERDSAIELTSRQWRHSCILRSMSTLLLVAASCWGLLVFIVYQKIMLNQPWAFVKGQAAWHERALPGGVGFEVFRLVTGIPIWSTFVSGCPCYWLKARIYDALMDLRLANPIVFVITLSMVAIGARKRWLNRGECVLSALLLFVPYVVQTPRQCMVSEARFSAVVFPAYLTAGHLLAACPRPLAAYVVICNGVLLGIYAMLFGLGFALV